MDTPSDERDQRKEKAGTRMRIRTIVIGAATAALVTGCGSAGSRSASLAGPPPALVLSTYITAGHLAVSPSRIGAGPVLMTVANQSPRSQSLLVSAAGGDRVIARTAPINPKGTTQLTIELRPGTYTVALAAARGRTQAARSQAAGAPAATLHVGRSRPSSDNDLLTP